MTADRVRIRWGRRSYAPLVLPTCIAAPDSTIKFPFRRWEDAEFKQKLLEERAVYQRILNPTTQ
jgi:hypothetical protein